MLKRQAMTHEAAKRLLQIYAGISWPAAPLVAAFAGFRVLEGKEEGRRLGERFGRPSKERPNGPILWLHGASIGESLALLPLISRLSALGVTPLVTTGTPSSAHVLAARLPGTAIHQYAPIDCAPFTRAFVRAWRPDALLLAESELWPNMIRAMGDRDAPIAIVNARMSEKSFQKWRRAPALAREILKNVDLCLAQDDTDGERFARLGADPCYVAGNLKYDVKAPPADAHELGRLRALVGARPVWTGHSTHEGEEEACLAAHRVLCAQQGEALLILTPRAAARGPDIASLAQNQGFRVGLRSKGQSPEPDRNVYVADTFGEAGLWLRLAGPAFLGGSWIEGRGQNPIEAVKLGSAVIHGPNVSAFEQAYRCLDQAGGALQITTIDDLSRALLSLMEDGAAMRAMARAGQLTLSQLTGATDRVMSALTRILPYLGETPDPQ